MKKNMKNLHIAPFQSSSYTALSGFILHILVVKQTKIDTYFFPFILKSEYEPIWH